LRVAIAECTGAHCQRDILEFQARDRRVDQYLGRVERVPTVAGQSVEIKTPRTEDEEIGRAARRLRGGTL
jgi:hypothetical protein